MRLSTIEKSLRTIELLSGSPEGLRLSEISNALGIPDSSAHHILSTLRAYDYVREDAETRKYTLGFRLLEISRRILNNLDVRAIARDHLRKLNAACGQTVHLAVLRDGRVVYIDKIEARAGLSLVTYVGFATDAYAAAGGKVLLADLRDSEVKQIYKNGALAPYGKRTITNVEDLLKELERIRGQGYAIDDEEYYEGVRCVAAPIRAGGKVVAAISITGSVFTLTMDRIDREFKEMVVRTAAEVSARLKW